MALSGLAVKDWAGVGVTCWRPGDAEALGLGQQPGRYGFQTVAAPAEVFAVNALARDIALTLQRCPGFAA